MDIQAERLKLLENLADAAFDLADFERTQNNVALANEVANIAVTFRQRRNVIHNLQTISANANKENP